MLVMCVYECVSMCICLYACIYMYVYMCVLKYICVLSLLPFPGLSTLPELLGLYKRSYNCFPTDASQTTNPA